MAKCLRAVRRIANGLQQPTLDFDMATGAGTITGTFGGGQVVY
ncbi:hypothetical protein ABFY41_00200 [Acinetobacter haemolyticus]